MLPIIVLKMISPAIASGTATDPPLTRGKLLFAAIIFTPS